MKSKSSLFLIELIISTLFFALSATVCVQMFVKAHLISNENQIIENATLLTQNLSDVWLSCDGNLEETASYFPGAVTDNHSLSLYLDSEWNTTSAESADFMALISEASEAHGINSSVTIYDIRDGKDVIMEVSLTKHIQLTKGNTEGFVAAISHNGPNEEKNMASGDAEIGGSYEE